MSRNTIRVFVVAPPTADGAHSRVRTTLKSTVSSAYGSNDDWHSLGPKFDQIHGWEAPYTALLYTLLHVRARWDTRAHWDAYHTYGGSI